MAARRQLAVLIWMAIVAIAIQFMPSVAWAHAGHAHGPVATVAQPTTSDEIRSTAEPATDAASAEVSEAAVTSADTRRSPVSSGTCPATCCTTGFSCCVPALVAESPPDLPG